MALSPWPLNLLGTVRRQAVDVSPLRRVNQAIWLLVTGAREAAFRNIKTIAECLGTLEFLLYHLPITNVSRVFPHFLYSFRFILFLPFSYSPFS